MGGHCYTLATLHQGKRPNTHFTGGWVGHMANLDGCRKSCSYRDSISGVSSL